MTSGETRGTNENTISRAAYNPLGKREAHHTDSNAGLNTANIFRPTTEHSAITTTVGRVPKDRNQHQARWLSEKCYFWPAEFLASYIQFLSPSLSYSLSLSSLANSSKRCRTSFHQNKSSRPSITFLQKRRVAQRILQFIITTHKPGKLKWKSWFPCTGQDYALDSFFYSLQTLNFSKFQKIRETTTALR